MYLFGCPSICLSVYLSFYLPQSIFVIWISEESDVGIREVNYRNFAAVNILKIFGFYIFLLGLYTDNVVLSYSSVIQIIILLS